MTGGDCSPQLWRRRGRGRLRAARRPSRLVAHGLHATGIRLVDTRHEAVAVNAADGYARTTGRIGVAFATAGAGFTNALAGLGPAYVDRSPVLLLTSSPPLRGRGDERPAGLHRPGGARHPRHEVGAPRDRRRGDSRGWSGSRMRTALTGAPGPVLLDLPIDVLFAAVDEAVVDQAGAEVRPPAPDRTREGWPTRSSCCARAERPVIVAGGGLRGKVPSAALVAFAELSRRAGVPPGMIVGAMPADHPLNGWVGPQPGRAHRPRAAGPMPPPGRAARFGLLPRRTRRWRSSRSTRRSSRSTWTGRRSAGSARSTSGSSPTRPARCRRSSPRGARR